MSKNSFLQTAVVLAVLSVPAPCLAQGDNGSSRVAVRVYDGAAFDDASRAAAIRIAAATVAETGVAATWLDCTGDSVRPRCRHTRADRELIIRISPTFVAGTVVSRGSIQSRTDGNAAGLVLGFAVVEPSTGAGALATVFMDRILAIAQRTAVPSGALLGRAIAHEVGHLLLGTNAHARSGLMREIWTDAELMLDRAEDWRFSGPERAALEPYTAR
jgi:hypothetical protein